MMSFKKHLAEIYTSPEEKEMEKHAHPGVGANTDEKHPEHGKLQKAGFESKGAVKKGNFRNYYYENTKGKSINIHSRPNQEEYYTSHSLGRRLFVKQHKTLNAAIKHAS